LVASKTFILLEALIEYIQTASSTAASEMGMKSVAVIAPAPSVEERGISREIMVD
jgi:hypothetical protein